MIWFFAGVATGSVLSFLVYSLMVTAKHADEARETVQADTGRLNEDKTEREKMLRELERQYDMMMRYNGKEQKK